MATASGKTQLQADLALLLVTAIWGSTFVMVKNAVATVDPYTFIALRFLLAFIVLGLVFSKRLRHVNRQTLIAGVIIGIFLFGGYAFQTIGLQYTSASKAGFITGLSVVLVPFLAAAIIRQSPTRNAVLGVVLAAIGLALLTLQDDLSMGYGDLVVLGCTLCFALHIVSVGKYAPQYDAMSLTTVQIGTVALASGVMAALFDGPPAALPADGLMAAAFTGIVATALVFAIQNKAQVFTTATHTALLFVMEPVFAAVFAYFVVGEMLTERAIVGCLLILAGMVVAEVRLPRRGPGVRGQGEGARDWGLGTRG